PSSLGASVTFIATISSAAGTPAGSIRFMDGAANLGSGTIAKGKATFPIASLAVGAHSITAVYDGSGGFSPSSSPVLTQTVNPASSSTSIVSSLNPSPLAMSVTFTVTVTSAGGTPSGTVTFKDGATTLGTFNLVNGAASFSTSALTFGGHAITA